MKVDMSLDSRTRWMDRPDLECREKCDVSKWSVIHSSIQQVFMSTYSVPSSVLGHGCAVVSKPCPHALRAERQGAQEAAVV